jgi:regulator of sigma D
MHNSSLGVKKVKGHEQLIDHWLEYLDRDLLSFAHLSDVLDSETERLMDQTFMRYIFTRKLKFIA